MRKQPRCYGVFVAVVLMAVGVAFAGDGVVALQSADASCVNDGGNRYVYCGNGTVADNQTGLVWLANVDCFGSGLNWNEAMEVVAGLADLPDGSCGDVEPDDCDCGLSDGSSPGEWRLPSMGELKVMTEAAVALGCSPALTRNSGTSCWSQPPPCRRPLGCAFYNVTNGWYWSASSKVTDLESAWYRSLTAPVHSATRPKSMAGMHVWPVRGGQ